MPGSTEIRYDADQMEQQGKRLVDLAERLTNEATEMDKIVAELGNDWAGQEYDAFVTEHGEFMPVLKSYIEAIGAFGNHVNNTAINARAEDLEGAKRVETLLQG